jgi:uncharacterized membrane protein (DUF373 family)
MFRNVSEGETARLASVITRAQFITTAAITILLAIAVVLSTVHLGYLIAEEMWKHPRFLIPVPGLLEIFGYCLLVLIGVELLETLKMYLKRDSIQLRVVIEVALIAMHERLLKRNWIRFQPNIVRDCGVDTGAGDCLVLRATSSGDERCLV